MEIDRFLEHFKDVKQTHPNEWQAKCPCHDDRVPSLSIGLHDEKILVKCHAGCRTKDILRSAKLQMRDLFLDYPQQAKTREASHKPITETEMLQRSQGHWNYTDEEGAVLYRTVRYPQGNGKRFMAYRPNGNGQWIPNITGVRRVLYRLPELIETDPSKPVFVVEGEKHVERLRSLGLTATCNPFGAGKWCSEYCESLRDRDVVILPDNDEPGLKHGDQVAELLQGITHSIKIVALPGLPPKGDVIDWLDTGHDKSDLLALVTNQEPRPSLRVQDARKAVEKWLELPDLDVVDLILATLIANEQPGDPVWMLLVGAPSSAKSELLRALGDAVQVYRLSSLTGKTLISGHKDAKGGLLFHVGKASTLLLLDFGQVLSLHPNEKALVLQRLREVYDGYSKADFGNRADSLEWQGKLGFLAGVTPAIEKYTSVGAKLGNRFLLYSLDVPNPSAQARSAMKHSGQETVMRRDLSQAFLGALQGVLNPTAVTVGEEALETLTRLAVLATRLRSAVSRNRYTRAIDYLPKPEGPARFAKALICLGKALAALRGETEITQDELRTLAKVSLDCIPSRRTVVVTALRDLGEATTKAIGLKANIATTSTGIILENLMYLGAVSRRVQTDSEKAPFHWSLKPKVLMQWDLVKSVAEEEELHTQKQTRDIDKETTHPIVFAHEADSEPAEVPF